MLHPIIIGKPPLEMECHQLAKLWGPGVEAPVLSPRLWSGSCVPASPRRPLGEFPELSLVEHVSCHDWWQRTVQAGCP